MNEFRSLADLLDLQALDSAIDRLLDDRANLPELEQFKSTHDEVNLVGKQLKVLEDRLAETTRALDKTEGELGLLEERARVTEQRLYAGGMNARETGFMQADVRMLKHQVSEMEDSVLVLIDEREALDGETNQTRASHEEVVARKSALEATIKDAWKRIDAEIARKETRKAELVPSIDPELVNLYEEVRAVHGGLGVGPLEKGVCGSCHVEMSPGEVATLKREEFPRCVHCNRLLVI